MSHISVIILAIVSIAVTTCRALPDIHKQMSAQQLQSVFHVDSSEAVPHYEVIQLLHHHSAEASPSTQFNNYRRRKRSIEPHADAMSGKGGQHPGNSLNDNNTGKHKDVKDIQEHQVSFEAFGQQMNLLLKQTEGLFKNDYLPMWYMDNVANATDGMNLEKIEDELLDTSAQIGQVYQDLENMAAILMRRHEVTGDLVMEGSIGHDMVIKPLPHELSPNPKESHHVVYKRDVDATEHLSDFAFMEPDDLATHEKLEKLQERHKRAAHRNTLADIELEEERLEEEDHVETDETAAHKRPKRQAPYMIYPEILVIIDYDGYRLHGGDNLQVKRYFIAFWNGVDLRYRLLKDPKIRVSIAGIIISRGRDATPYLERNRVGRDAIDSAAALTDMGKYLFRERRLPVYDIAVAITKYDMCRRRKGGRCTKGTAGFAYVGGACVVNRRLEKVNSVAIIEDTGGFSGIIVAAHEVGHLLGAVHDGSPPPSYLGGPGAQRCRWEDGFIMSDLRHTERGFRWSACSVQSFQHFLNGATATCLYNVPHEDNALGRSLPGTLLSLDAQCRRDRGTYACFKDERVCAQLFCFDAQTGYCVAYRPAAEGSTCGNNLHCLDGRCAPLQVASNLISNYGPRTGINNSLNNAATKHLHNGKSSAHHQGDSGNEDEEDEDEDEDEGNNADNNNDEEHDNGEDNDESNETIEKQKRKLNTPESTISSTTTTTTTTTTTSSTNVGQYQQASPPKPIVSTSTSATDSPLNDLPYGAKSSGHNARSPSSSIYDSYLRKLQTLNAQVATTTEISASQAARTTVEDYSKTLDKTEPSLPTTISQFDGLHRRRAEGQVNTPTTLSSFPSQSSLTKKAFTKIPKSSYGLTSSGHSSSSNYKFLAQQQQQQQQPQTLTETETYPHPTSAAAYVTNYIGDNTQRLAAIVQQHQQPSRLASALPMTNLAQQQQLQHQHHLQAQQQPQNSALVASYAGASSTRRPKIKTQKLIRRLRTQIK